MRRVTGLLKQWHSFRKKEKVGTIFQIRYICGIVFQISLMIMYWCYQEYWCDWLTKKLMCVDPVTFGEEDMKEAKFYHFDLEASRKHRRTANWQNACEKLAKSSWMTGASMNTSRSRLILANSAIFIWARSRLIPIWWTLVVCHTTLVRYPSRSYTI